MKRISSILIILALVLGFQANAQRGDKKEKELKSKQVDERSRSLGGQRNPGDMTNDKSTANTENKKTESADAADTVSTAANSADNRSVVERNKDQSGRPAK